MNIEKIWNAIKDWWEVAIAFGGAIISAYNIASQLLVHGSFSLNVIVAIGLLLFLLFGAIAILKEIKKGRDKKKTTITDKQNIGVQSKNQSGGFTAQTINIQPFTQQREESILRDVDLTIIPQQITLDENPYVIISVKNNEKNTVSCRVEIHGIYNITDENIKREISQYANLFSWSGGSQNGSKEILAGLDGTVNLITRRTNAYGFYFLFQENPDTNWKKPGIYKLDIEIKGTIREEEFIGKRVVMKVEYIEKEERDSIGGFFNRGLLKLVEWHIDKDI